MSIVSSILAEYNNSILDAWVKELEIAYNNKDWKLINELFNKMKNFRFSE